MSKDVYQNKYRVESTRLPWWDYSSGDYFITICTREFIHYFGEVVDDKIKLNSCGNIVHQQIIDTMKMRKNVIIDTFIVMPNHIHMIICISDPRKWICRDALHASHKWNEKWNTYNQKWATCNVALHNRGDGNKFGPQKNNLASIVRGLKSSIASKIKNIVPEFAWQSSFYECIIKTNYSFQNIREYIENNPMNRKKDRNNVPL